MELRHFEGLEGIFTGASQSLTVSIGLATAGPGEATNFNTLYVLADQALYEGKHGGRNQVVTRG